MSKLSADMSSVTRIGLDLAKHVFQVHAVDDFGNPIDKRAIRRAKLIDYFAALEPCTIGMEACSSAHHWARQFEAMGHRVMLIPPIYVKPFVKRQKTDANDAAAICEAMGRPGMRCVPVRSIENQAAKMVHGVRETLSGQRVQLLNALRGHLAEAGVIAAQGHQHARKLAELVEQGCDRIPACVRDALLPLVARLRDIEAALDGIDKRIAVAVKADPDARLLMTIPGVGRSRPRPSSRRSDRGASASSAGPRTSRPGSGSPPGSTPPAASSGSDGSPRWATVTSGSCSWWGRTPC